MDKKSAQTAVVISALASFGIVTIHDIMKGQANAKAYIGGAFVFLVLAGGADVAPGVAGPMAYLVLAGVTLTDGKSVLTKVGKANAPVGDKTNVLATGQTGQPVPNQNGIIGGNSNPVNPLDPGNSGGILPSPTLGNSQGDALAQLIVKEALSFQGTPYVFGGASPGGFDCSGFVYYLANKYAHITLPRTSQQQATSGAAVPVNQIKPGDLVFFTFSKAEGGEGTPNDHEGIYIGGGKFIQAPHTGDSVKISSLSGTYASHLTAIRRVF